MNKLLKEAIADAKAVRETALANAKLALEEAFTPRLQSMLSAKLSEEDEMDEGTREEEMEEGGHLPNEGEHEMEEGMHDEKDMEEGMRDEKEVEEGMHEDDMEEGMHEDDIEEEGHAMSAPAPMAAPESDEDDLELEAIIKELEDEMEEGMHEDDLDEGSREEKEVDEVSDSSKIGTGDNKLDYADSKDQDDPGKGKLKEEEEVDEDISIDEIIQALKEEDDVDEGSRGDKEVDETEDKEKTDETKDDELKEAYNVISFLKGKINEVNLLNAKLLFSNKLFRNYAMNESQKMRVIENFDRASTIREVKLVYSTLAESMKVNKTKRIVKESTASAPTRSTAPKKILSEGNALASRWAKLAGLNKS